jgi:nitrite reductase/ring-hydroxylating ferredoxin subunit
VCDRSRFDVRTGAVLRGPATDPPATLQARGRDGRIEIEA